MAKRDVPHAGHSDPSTKSTARSREAASFAARRLVSLLGRIRNGARKTLDAIQSKAFYGSLDQVLPVTPEEVNAAVSYLSELGLCHEETQQLRRDYDGSWKAGGFLQSLMRNPPPVLNYPASDDDPDDPEVARVKQVNAERFADHERMIDDQRGIAIDAVSALLNRVDDLVEAVESMPRGDHNEAGAEAVVANGDGRRNERGGENPPKDRTVSAKSEKQIEQAIRDLPRASTQKAVAEKAGVDPRTVRDSKAWAKRWVLWDSGEPSLADQDTLLDLQDFVTAKLEILHPKTRARVERLLAHGDKRDQLFGRLAKVDEDLASRGKSLRGLPDSTAKETIRSAAEQVDEASNPRRKPDKCPA